MSPTDSAPAKVPPGINMRMARAGCYVLAGSSLKQALIKAGYAEATARKPKRNGLTAERCVAEAKKLDGGNDPRTLLVESRALALRQVRAAAGLPDRDLVAGKAAMLVPRILETVERYHGETPQDPGGAGARSLQDRAAQAVAILSELQRRGMIAAPAGHENAGSRDPDGGRLVEVEVLPPTKK